MVLWISLRIRISSRSAAKPYISRHFSLQFSSLAEKMANDEDVIESVPLKQQSDDVDVAGPATGLTSFGGSCKKMFVGSIAIDLESPSFPYRIPKHDYNQMLVGGIAINLENPSVPYHMPKHDYLSGNQGKASNCKKLTRVAHFAKRGICSLKPLQSPKLSSPTNDENLVLQSPSHRSNIKDRYSDRKTYKLQKVVEEVAGVPSSLEENLFMDDTNYNSLPRQFEKKTITSKIQRTMPSPGMTHPGYGRETRKDNEGSNRDEPFDICRFKFPYAIHQERSDEMVFSSEEPQQKVLRPGMVLLKGYLGLGHQIEIVNICRKLGLGPGGFYRAGYKDGAKLCYWMMCLGLDWDPQTRKYDTKLFRDGGKPPSIPHGFNLLVKKAMKDSHALIEKDVRVNNAEDILPWMVPDICIANFYTTGGRLGLHQLVGSYSTDVVKSRCSFLAVYSLDSSMLVNTQDRDESKESLLKGLPIVSFSIGNSAEFLFGDQRNPNKAELVVLESGDVLIFGGESRHIFHGVSAIIPNTAPRSLLEETKLQPGRLNLTFRQF
ncbi:Alpha-ketoglutarate-dependent dioxygenase AlkB-like [Dillenia turbinata]|uniref:Alpha-ketoglutarate-dependent dioxygenase AlkB-like n=1 Tax=Dillenia turbinata TaxID=194707 RepID=A0AAN8ZJA2_9MAGN